SQSSRAALLLAPVLSSHCAAPPRALHPFPTRRSSDLPPPASRARGRPPRAARASAGHPRSRRTAARPRRAAPWSGTRCAAAAVRSEEHTSELQSRENLVCRLLLEKKKVSGEGHVSPQH